MAGNASVTLNNGKRSTTYEIWLTTFRTSSDNQLVSQQVRNEVNWIPVRRAETYVMFTAVWPLVGSNTKPAVPLLGFEDLDPADGFGRMQRFQEAIYAHMRAYVNGTTNDPMVLNYYNNSDAKSPIYNTLISNKPLTQIKPFSGYIRSVEKKYERFTDVFYTNYTMSVINKNVSSTPPTQMQAGTSISYAPTAYNQRAYGSEWVNTQVFINQAQTIQGLPSNS